MKLSVVIVNYNVRYFLELCLLSVKKACKNIDSEIIVVDNLSTDDSCKMVAKNFPEVVLIENKINYGFSTANNQGVAVAKGEYVLILNPDTVIGENTFLEMLSFADTKPDLGALGVQLIDGTGVFLPESKRGIPTLKASLFKILGSDSKKGTYYSNHLERDEIGTISILVGAFMLMKRNVYEEVGGFDEDYFMYGEDIDLSYKLLKVGYKNYYLGTSKIIHFKGESTRKDVKYLKYFHGAMEIFYKKHFSSNFCYDFAMKLGVKIWFLTKYFQLSDAPIIIKERENVLYVGEKKISIDPQMQRKINFVKFKSFKQLERHAIKKNVEEIWLDESYLSYEKIIEIIALLHSKKIIFKIHSAKTSYVIGSNSSDGRGEIIGLN
ncbi:glycosyltransferase family 2 protein [Flavicella sediminum]|uniref:glycosyltransferase family 2 protein n=1 Tax=Flavicella sediminum TaxID=2585141 RepID=UPI00111DF2A7|nr:glycosyltransferase family 2 protein [Flavicella sediminum]